MHIEISSEPNEELFAKLVNGVRQYNFKYMGEETSKPVMVVAHNDDGKLIAGAAGCTIYHQLLVDVLWVDSSMRGCGLGSQLMKMLEQEAKNRGCTAAQVDTLSFQAPDFYQKQDYKIVGQVTGIKNSPDRFFLLKVFE